MSKFELVNKPDVEIAMERIEAWYNQEIIDRAPIRFSAHNAEFEETDGNISSWKSLKDRWYDEEYQVDKFVESMADKKFYAETFPVYCPNLGPNFYAALYAGELVFGDITTWIDHPIKSFEDIPKLNLDLNNEYLKKMDSLTRCALEKCKDNYFVGFTDLQPNLSAVQAWVGTDNLCFALYDNPEGIKQLAEISVRDWPKVYNHFDRTLKEHKQPSVSWLLMPFDGRMHIPSCDFAAMISTEHFVEFSLPPLKKEIATMDYNIYHLDGKGVAKHLDAILDVDGINAIQWVQGMGEDIPILQWVPLIKHIQERSKSVVIDLQPNELEDFMGAIKPKGIFLCIQAKDEEEQVEIIKKVERWY